RDEVTRGTTESQRTQKAKTGDRGLRVGRREPVLFVFLVFSVLSVTRWFNSSGNPGFIACILPTILVYLAAIRPCAPRDRAGLSKPRSRPEGRSCHTNPGATSHTRTKSMADSRSR